MKKNLIRMVGAKLEQHHRDMLAAILNHYKRTFKGQLVWWIENEKRIIDRA